MRCHFACNARVIHLRSEKFFQRYVKALGDHLIHVEKLSGKDFYDALIRIEDIAAVEAKFRDLKSTKVWQLTVDRSKEDGRFEALGVRREKTDISMPGPVL
jgi:hypothetical protein